MKQYCRYCKNATMYGKNLFMCKGGYGSGKYRRWKIRKVYQATRINRCWAFKFTPTDLLNSKHTYKPHGAMYCKVTKDEFENIEALADTSKELAEMCGVKQTTVLKGVERYEKGQNTQWRRIMI